MFAVLKTGGKQYKVQAGDVLRVEKLDAIAGDKDPVQRHSDGRRRRADCRSPLVAGAAVQAEVIDQIKGDKIIHYVKRRRKHSSQRTKGHRQHLTLVRVTDVLASGADKSGVKAAATGTRRMRRACGPQYRSRGPGGRGPGETEARRPRPPLLPRSNTRWHTRKQAVHPATVATRPVVVWA